MIYRGPCFWLVSSREFTKGRVIIRKGAFDLEREAFKASEIKEKNELAEYSSKLEDLLRQSLHQTIPASAPLTQAKALFLWLWKEKPARYEYHGCYRLNNVIDAQLSAESQAVGNCLGLTVLYNCLLRRMGIVAEAVYLENAFGMGPHVLTTVPMEGSLIDVENILRQGFDYQGHLDDRSRIRWKDRELVADIYHSAGNEFFSKGEFLKALENYDIALRLNPRYEKARLNKAILLDKMKREGKAM
jgi:tetratricopeptide (TPR) repeat protein